MTNRIQIVQNLLSDFSLDAILITSPKNIAYLTNYYGFSDHERDAYVLITKSENYLFSNSLYESELKGRVTDFKLVITNAKQPFKMHLQKIYTHARIRTVGFEDTNLTVSEFQKISFTNVSYLPLDLRHIRIRKSIDEITSFKKACELTDKAFGYISSSELTPGITELELATRLELFIKQNGADISFKTIVAFGKNSATPHHHTDDTTLKVNDIVLIDFGVKMDDYCSDMTRTFFVGKPTNEQQKVYDVVLQSQKKAVEYINEKLKNTEKVKAKEVDHISREYIISQGFPSIPHSLGHGIGLEVHEAPSLSPFSEDVLEEGMIFSIEPGIYLPAGEQASQGFGVRIEDLYVIQNEMLTPLTQSNTSLIPN